MRSITRDNRNTEDKSPGEEIEIYSHTQELNTRRYEGMLATKKMFHGIGYEVFVRILHCSIYILHLLLLSIHIIKQSPPPRLSVRDTLKTYCTDFHVVFTNI